MYLKRTLLFVLIFFSGSILFAQTSINGFKQAIFQLISEGSYVEAKAVAEEGLQMFPGNDELAGLLEKTNQLIQLQEIAEEPDDNNQEEPSFDEVNESDVDVTYRPPESDPDRLNWRNTGRMTIGGDYILGMDDMGNAATNYSYKDSLFLGANIRAEYYLPALKKLVGFAMDYQGVYFRMNDSQLTGTYYNQLTGQLVFRSMMKEEQDSRDILNLSIGGGLAISQETGSESLFWYPVMLIGLYYESPFLYNLFGWDDGKDLIIEINVEFTYVLRENLNTLQLNFGLGYQFGNLRISPYLVSDNSDLSEWQTQILTFGIRLAIDLY